MSLQRVAMTPPIAKPTVPLSAKLTARQATGRAGEALAVRHLQGAGYTIVTTGWRCALGEIDIVAQQTVNGVTEWVFVEVRTRYNADLDAALESIGKRKQAKLIALANAYLAAAQLAEVPYRIDVVAVCFMPDAPPQVEIIENAIGW